MHRFAGVVERRTSQVRHKPEAQQKAKEKLRHWTVHANYQKIQKESCGKYEPAQQPETLDWHRLNKDPVIRTPTRNLTDLPLSGT